MHVQCSLGHVSDGITTLMEKQKQTIKINELSNLRETRKVLDVRKHSSSQKLINFQIMCAFKIESKWKLDK